MLQGRLHAQTRRPWFLSQTSQRSDFQLQSLGLQAVAMKRSKGHQRLEHRRSRDRLPLQRNPDQGTPESGVVAAKALPPLDHQAGWWLSLIYKHTVFKQVAVKGSQFRWVPEHRDAERGQFIAYRNRARQAVMQLDVPIRRVHKPRVGDQARGTRRPGWQRRLGDDGTSEIVRARPGQPEATPWAFPSGSRAVRAGFPLLGTIAAGGTT
ncbi:hypothetical protein VDGL01_00569 [Verticillium dahliae]